MPTLPSNSWTGRLATGAAIRGLAAPVTPYRLQAKTPSSNSKRVMPSSAQIRSTAARRTTSSEVCSRPAREKGGAPARSPDSWSTASSDRA